MAKPDATFRISRLRDSLSAAFCALLLLDRSLFVFPRLSAEPPRDRQQEHDRDRDWYGEGTERRRHRLVVLSQVVSGIREGEVPGDRAGHRGEREFHVTDPRQACRKRNVGADDRQQPPYENCPETKAIEESIRETKGAGAQSHSSSRAAEHHALAITAGEPESDQRAGQVCQAADEYHHCKLDDGAAQAQLALRSESTAKRDDDLAGDRKAGALSGHGDKDRDVSPRRDQADQQLSHVLLLGVCSARKGSVRTC